MRPGGIWIFGAVLAALPPLAGQAFPLERLSITGNEEFASDRIVAASGLKIGQDVTERDFNAARDRLLATGAFESVGFEYRPSAAGTGFDATFEVVETAPLYAYRFEALGRIDAVLREAVRQQEPVMGDRIPATPQVLNRYTAALRRFLGEGTEVAGEINSDLPGEVMIVFRPPGARANISGVYFEGNQVLPTPELMAAMSRVAIGVPFSEPLFRTMLEQTLAPLYEERGRIRLAFPSIRTEKSTENEGVEVTVTIDEGPSYNLGEVRIEGVPRSQAEELAKEAAWNTGGIANFVEIRAGIDRIRKRFHARGFLRAELTTERELDDAARVVNLAVEVVRGPQFTMGSLTIKGLDIISEPQIRKAWGMPEGYPYQGDYADAFVKKIMEEGWFDNLARTGAEAVIHDDTETVDVILTFEGGQLAPENQRQPGRR
jgi:outer membrane protein insertion porin family